MMATLTSVRCKKTVLPNFHGIAAFPTACSDLFFWWKIATVEWKFKEEN
uniref:Uncharacterized protein n=1 Tax=Medicago truncatula TaxID=3880 RepID=I3T6A3_MEDTR|nr:unknown [Medicago truncatula]